MRRTPSGCAPAASVPDQSPIDRQSRLAADFQPMAGPGDQAQRRIPVVAQQPLGQLVALADDPAIVQ